MKLFGRAVMSGVLVAGMALPAVVPAAAQMGHGAPRGGQYASSYYGGNSGYNNGYYGNDRGSYYRGDRDDYRNGGYAGGYRNDGYNGSYRVERYNGGAYRDDGRYYDNRGGIGPGKGAVIGGVAGVVLGGLLGGGKGALIGGAAGAGIGAAAGAANKDSHRYDYGGYRRY